MFQNMFVIEHKSEALSLDLPVLSLLAPLRLPDTSFPPLHLRWLQAFGLRSQKRTNDLLIHADNGCANDTQTVKGIENAALVH